jgi:hypothetical protein
LRRTRPRWRCSAATASGTAEKSGNSLVPRNTSRSCATARRHTRGDDFCGVTSSCLPPPLASSPASNRSPPLCGGAMVCMVLPYRSKLAAGFVDLPKRVARADQAEPRNVSGWWWDEAATCRNSGEPGPGHTPLKPVAFSSLFVTNRSSKFRRVTVAV